MNAINEHVARRVLEVVDAGLVLGLGKPLPGKMCAAAAVCYALGLPHSDVPACVSPAARLLMIGMNDARWSSPAARARGLRRLVIAALGSRGVLDEGEFANRVTRIAIQFYVPAALRAAAESPRRTSARRYRLLRAADLCEREPTRKNVLEARVAATDAYASAVATDIAAACAYGAAAGAASAVAAAVAAASASATSYAVCGVRYAAEALADYDNALAEFAERVVHVLRDLGSPGAAYLYLTDC